MVLVESLDDFDCPAKDYVQNPLGDCLCHGQVFNDASCGTGFYCTDVANNLGCLKTCDSGYTLYPFYDNDAWECFESMTEAEGPDCVGAYELPCPDNAVQAEASECECPNQLLISHDCKSGYYCQSEINGGGLTKCGDNEEIIINLPDWSFFCMEDKSNCPSLGGGSTVGCEGGSPMPNDNDYLCTHLENNPIGTCQCANQVFIDTDCR